MSVWRLEAYGTDSRYADDVRYREYTTSARRAEEFAKIPKIQWTDSGHGIVFVAIPHSGKRPPVRLGLSDYVHEQLAIIRAAS